MEINFGASTPYTVGVEEEFQLVDPETFALVPAIEAVLTVRDAVGIPASFVSSELSASCLEVRSPVYGTVAELAEELPVLRRRVRDLVERCRTRLAAAGTHPFSDSAMQPITEKERYRRVEEKMGWTARMQAIYGLHVHVAVPDAEYAIRAVNVLSRHVPLFIALSANSPFWSGQDTRLSSTRTKVFSLVPRSGLPPHFRFWKDFEGYVDTLVASGGIPDYSWCWWDARPHPKLGTVELRATDAQTDTARTASLAALVQCLVATAAHHRPEDPPRSRSPAPRLLRRPERRRARGGPKSRRGATTHLSRPRMRGPARRRVGDCGGWKRCRQTASRPQGARLASGGCRVPGRDRLMPSYCSL